MPHRQDDKMHPDEEETGMTMGERLMQKGAEQAQRRVLLRLLGHRFGALPVAVAERIDAARFADLQRWFERVLPARSLDDVFADEHAADAHAGISDDGQQIPNFQDE